MSDSFPYKNVAFASLEVGGVACLFWPFAAATTKAALTPYSQGRPPEFKGVSSAVRHAITKQGFFPTPSTAGKHQMVPYFAQMVGNTATHKTAEAFTENPAIVAFAAAIGAFPGTRGLVKNEIGTPTRRLSWMAVALACEWGRELVYNKGCLNGGEKVKALLNNRGGVPAQLLLTAAVAAAAGAASGVANVAAVACHAGQSPLRSFQQGHLSWTINACKVRGVGSAAIFTTVELYNLWRARHAHSAGDGPSQGPSP